MSEPSYPPDDGPLTDEDWERLRAAAAAAMSRGGGWSGRGACSRSVDVRRIPTPLPAVRTPQFRRQARSPPIRMSKRGSRSR